MSPSGAQDRSAQAGHLATRDAASRHRSDSIPQTHRSPGGPQASAGPDEALEQDDTGLARARAGERWFVVQTHPRKEAFAAMHLGRQKFTSFWPRFRKTVRHARKSREVLAPLFPGYLFVRFDPMAAPWRCVNSTFGVRGLVGGRDHVPVPVPEAVMEHILSRCDNGIVRSTLADFQPGQTVKVLAGPFAERLARIVECDERGRVALLLELLGQDHVVSMQSTSVGLA